jgi:hypothetical protein
MKEAIDLLQESYIAWFSNGIETGDWQQKGTINLIGAAGVGKTQMIRELGEECAAILTKKYPDLAPKPNSTMCELYTSASLDPESVAGANAPGWVEIPQEDGTVERVPSLVMHYRAEFLLAQAKGPGAWIFWDEWGTEGRHMRPLGLKLTSWQKNLAGLDCSKMFLVLASNPSDDDHQVEDTDQYAPFSSRIIDINVLPDPQHWAAWMYELTPSHRAVADFIVDNHALLCKRDQAGQKRGKFLSPRSWDIAAHNLHIHGYGTDTKPGDPRKHKLALAVVAGIVGSGPANLLTAYMTTDRPMSVKQVLRGDFEVNKDSGRITSCPRSLIQGIQYHLRHKDLNDDQADNLARFLKAIPGDWSASIIRDADRIRPNNMVKFASRDLQGGFLGRIRKVKTT